MAIKLCVCVCVCVCVGVVRLCGGEPSRITIYVCVLVFKVPNDLVAPVMGFRFTQCVCVCVCVCV